MVRAVSALAIPTAPRGGQEGVRLFAFTVGWMTLPMTIFLAGEEGQIRFPATAYLIDHPRGAALFDTGLGSRFERPAGTPVKGRTDLEADGTIAARLLAIGVDPADIRWIVNSHLHTDHAGGNFHFPNATVIVQAAEHDYAFGEGDRAYFRAEYDLGQPFRRVSGEHDLFGDGSVILFPTPGHTPGHQSARVQTAGGAIVLAADCCNLKRSLDDLHIPAYCHNADLYLGTLGTLRTMRDRGARIFYGHDPEFFASLPQGAPIV